MSDFLEKWIDIPNYEGLYKISNLGKVKSLEKSRMNGKNLKILRVYPEKNLKTRISNTGYELVTLSKNGKLKTFSVHRLVAFSFFNDIEKKVVNHIDFNKLNNKLSNLEVISNLENNCHFSNKDKNKSSKFIGVHFCKKVKKWKAQISFNGKKIGLGYFSKEEEAYERRKNFEIENKIINKYL
jgi:hypothetical protein